MLKKGILIFLYCLSIAELRSNPDYAIIAKEILRKSVGFFALTAGFYTTGIGLFKLGSLLKIPFSKPKVAMGKIGFDHKIWLEFDKYSNFEYKKLKEQLASSSIYLTIACASFYTSYKTLSYNGEEKIW